jgi:OPA family sugar phosphate sensor protein UhpC-like MFS transporter
LVFGVLEVLALVVIFYGPAHPLSLSLGFLVYGFTNSGLIGVLGGLFAVDVAPKRAAGAAMGIVGIFSYVGAGLQEYASGVLIARGVTMVDGVRHYDFSLPVMFWVGASALSLLLATTLWRVRAREDT